MSRENVEVVRKAFDAYRRGEGAEAFFDPQGVWNPADEAPMTGAEEVRAYLERWEGEWERLDTVAEEFVDAGDKVLVTVHFWGKGRGSGIEVDARLHQVYTLRNGLIMRMDEFTDRAEALEAVGPRG